MRRTLCHLSWLVLAAAAAGCGDTPRACFRDAIQAENELADAMTEVYDNDSAERIAPKTRLDRLEAKWKEITDRMDKFTKNPDERTNRALLQGAVDTVAEASEASLRLKIELERLKAIKHQLGGNAPAIDALISAASTYDVGKLWSENPLFKGGGGFPGMMPGGMPGGMPGMPGGGKGPPGGFPPGAGPPNK